MSFTNEGDDGDEIEIANAINVDPVKIRQSILLMKEKCSKSIDELIVYLNQLPEIIPRKTKLLEPIQIEYLHWEQFKSEMNLSWSTTRLYKRSLKNLNFKSKRHQMYCFSEVLELYMIIQPTSIKSALAILFNITRSNVSSLILSYNRLLDSYPVINMAGRPFILSNDQMEELLNTIMLKEKQYLPMSKTDILLYVSEKYDKQFTKKWVSRLIKSHDELSIAEAIPLDEVRTEVTNDQLDEYFNELKEIVNDVHPSLICNVDEIGFSRRSQGKKKKCVILTRDLKLSKKRKVYYQQITDNTKTFTLIASISASGDRLIPLIICPVQSFPSCFLQNTIWQEKDCVLAYNESGFDTTHIFELWFEKVFLPYIEINKYKLYGDKYAKKWAVLICDGMTGHGSERIKSFAAHYYVKIIFLPAHSSHFLQALDKYVFANMKRIYYNGDDSCETIDRNCKKILKILRSFYQATTPFAIRSSFKSIGIEVKWSSKGEFIETIINDSYIKDNHQEKIETEKSSKEAGKKRRKRIQLENKEEFFIINESQICEESMEICALCHQLKPQDYSLFRHFENKLQSISLIMCEIMLTTVQKIVNFNSVNEKSDESERINSIRAILSQFNLSKDHQINWISPEMLIHPNHILLQMSKEIESKLIEYKENEPKPPKRKIICQRMYDNNSDKREDYVHKEYTLPKINKTNEIDKMIPGVRGIQNIKAKICALCSALQILLHTIPLNKLLLKTQWEDYIDPSKSPMARMLKALSIQFWSAPIEIQNGSIPPVNPSEILNYIDETCNLGDGQYDAMELLIIIISEIKSEFSSVNPNPIEQIFDGVERDEIICLNCGYMTSNNSSFNFISLPWTQNKKYKMNFLFKKWCDWQKQSSSCSRICENCKQKVQVKNRNVIIKLPHVFFVSVPRNTLEDHRTILDAFRALTIDSIGGEGPFEVQKSHCHLLYGYINHLIHGKNAHYVSHINVGARKWDNPLIFDPKLNERWFVFNDSIYEEESFNLISQQLACMYAYVGTKEIEFSFEK